MTGFMDFRIANLDAAFSFVLWEGLISLAVISVLFYLAGRIKNWEKINKLNINPILSMAMIAIALVLTLVKF
jgi:competence protein ComGC